VLAVGCASTSSGEPLSAQESRAALLANSSPRTAELDVLEPMVGTFQTRSRLRTSPEQPWIEAVGTCTNHWIEDGRFLASRVEGPRGRATLDGAWHTGFDAERGEFVFFSMDAHGAVIPPIRRGKAAAESPVITYSAQPDEEVFFPWLQVTRVVQTIAGPDAHAQQVYARIGDQPEFLMLSLEFTR
jgi:hypothetical protein